MKLETLHRQRDAQLQAVQTAPYGRKWQTQHDLKQTQTQCLKAELRAFRRKVRPCS